MNKINSKLNLVYEAYKNSKISLLEFLNKTTKNNVSK